MQIRGVLKKAQRVLDTIHGGFSLRGTIHDDIHGEYGDGWFHYTAKVLEEIAPNIFKTATGNLYRVEAWALPSRPTSELDAATFELLYKKKSNE